MSIKFFAFLTSFIFSCNTTHTDSTQTIDVLNNSAQALHLNANNANHSFCLSHTVPAFAKSLIIVQITQLKSLQDMLFEGILNNSPKQICKAIRAGADVNLAKEGKRPLLWATTFHRVKAIQCLLEHGAV